MFDSDAKLTWFGFTAIAAGIGIFFLIKYLF